MKDVLNEKYTAMLVLIAIALIFFSCGNKLKKGKRTQHKGTEIIEVNPTGTDTPPTGTQAGTDNQAGTQTGTGAQSQTGTSTGVTTPAVPQAPSEVCTGFDPKTYTFDTFDQEKDAAARLHGLKCEFQSGTNLRAHQGANGTSFLHSAADKGDLESVKYLIEIAKFEVNEKDGKGETALIFAARNAMKVMPPLNSKGETALMIFLQKGHSEAVQYLVETIKLEVNTRDIDRETALENFFQKGYLDVMKYLIETAHADLNVSDDQYENVLMIFFQRGRLDIVKYLVEHGADVNTAKNSNGETALTNAALHGHLDIIKYLIDTVHADANAKDKYGFTALRWAASSGYLDIVTYLVDHGANVNANANEETALINAASSGHLDIVKYLVSKNADVNANTRDGITALMFAASAGHLDVVQYLVGTAKADVEIRDSYGRTALMFAAPADHLDIVKYLVSVGADVTLRDNNLDTACEMADRDLKTADAQAIITAMNNCQSTSTGGAGTGNP